MESRLVADPLRLFHCCPISDGARRGRAHRRAPGACGSRASGRGRTRSRCATGRTSRRSAPPRPRRRRRIAWPASGRSAWRWRSSTTPSRPFELISLEDTGLVPAGKAGRATLDGETALGGRLPVNPSGGLKARGHPLAATGIAQIVELCWQLTRRGRRGARCEARVGAGPVHRRARHQQLGDPPGGAPLMQREHDAPRLRSRCPRCRRLVAPAGAPVPGPPVPTMEAAAVPATRRGRVVHHAALAARGVPGPAAHRARRARRRARASSATARRPRACRIGSHVAVEDGRLRVLLLAHGLRRPGAPLLAPRRRARREGGRHRQEPGQGHLEGGDPRGES